MPLPTAPSPSRQTSLFRPIFTAVAVGAVLGSAFLWWRVSHVDQDGRIPQPNFAVNVPGLLLQATALKNGVHCVCMTGYPRWKFDVGFERQTHISEPGYARANMNWSGAGFRFVLLTHSLTRTDSLLSPFCAIVFPYWFLVTFFACLIAIRPALSYWRTFKFQAREPNNAAPQCP